MTNMQELIRTLRDDLQPDTERGRLVRSAAATAAMKAGAIVIAFLASLLYARVLGPHDYGLYAYVIAWTAVLTIPASLGLPQYLVREGAKLPKQVSGLRRWADTRVLVTSMCAGVLLACAAWLPQAADARTLFVLAAPIPLLANLSAVRQSLLQARGWIVRSQWPQMIASPLATLVALLALWIFFGRLSPLQLVVVTTLSALLPWLINAKQLRHLTGRNRNKEHPSGRIRSALPFMWLGGLYLINNQTDLIMVGTLKGAHEAGIYAVSSRAAQLMTFFAATANIVMAPRIAQLYHTGQTAKLQILISKASVRFLLATLPIAAILILAAHPLLTFFYGGQFGAGTKPLQILAFAQLVVMAIGSASTILSMTDNVRYSLYGVGVSAALNIVLNVILTPLYGAIGAATATAISITLAQVIMWHWVRSKLNIRSSGFGI
jgi:O-antigen/teichoic acid export membrane protein